MKNKLKILYEDKHILVVNKPPKLLTIATANEKTNTLYHQVFEYLKRKNQKTYIIHRLDKDTSGIVMFAKSEKVKRLIQDNWNNTKRYYQAIVKGKINDNGEIHNYLAESKSLVTYITDKKHGKEAITKYKLLQYNNKLDLSLIDIEILTGRKNQIRVHMQSINHPILGDVKYGNNKNKRMYLHAYKIVFYHPIHKETITIESVLPTDFSNIFKKQL